ncbi:MAG: type I glyceraldehyde-3-phosphate dehydrogenase [Methylococcaceae bacterium TMED69]|nr:MAG: type I glyceraldehyde-3-phosphate dehydrogenase [Methylococcaceae bacterium TMED69]|tara:strand:- start:5030 stop:6043 length:1014 start_codon:yes stop_codon:yes gene_type:complete
MTLRIAVNGFGRIGRNIIRAHYQTKKHADLEFIAINDLGDTAANAHLLKYDSAYGPMDQKISSDSDHIQIGHDKIFVLNEKDPSKLPWEELKIDIVFECTGIFANKNGANQHIASGAKKVLISAPAGNDVDATIVYGVNDNVLLPSHKIVSNASCTTNCLAPLVKPLAKQIGVESGLMTTVHAYTNDQVLSDVYHDDLRRARSATQSIIPTKTGAASAVGLVLPELKGKLDGYAVRVPTLVVSLVDLTFKAKRNTSAEEVNRILKEEANSTLQGILGFCEEPLVSIDFKGDPRSSIVDPAQTKVIEGNLVKVVSWYDNEWGFSNRMLDTAKKMKECS